MNYFSASLMLYSNYYPFGMLMPNRHGQDDDYRYGFNGEEMDNEVFGTQGTNYDLGARTFDTRIGRMRSIDPWIKKYPWQSPYVYHKNSPIGTIDWKGYGGPEGTDPIYHNTSASNATSILNSGTFMEGKTGWSYFMTNPNGRAAGASVANAPVQLAVNMDISGATQISSTQWSSWFSESKVDLGFGDIENGDLTPDQRSQVDARRNSKWVKYMNNDKGSLYLVNTGKGQKLIAAKGSVLKRAMATGVTKGGNLVFNSINSRTPNLGEQHLSRSTFGGNLKYAQWAGRGMIFVAAGQSAINIYYSDNKAKEITKEVVGWTAAGTAFTYTTAAAWETGPWAPVIGAVGAGVGYWWGTTITELLWDITLTNMGTGETQNYSVTTPEEEKPRERPAGGYSGGGICFVKGTLVKTKKSWKKIELLKIGDSVYSFNFDSKIIEIKPIIYSQEETSDSIIGIVFGKDTIFCTQEHPFYTINKGWVAANDLMAGDEVKTMNENNAVVSYVIIQYKNDMVVNIQVKDNQNYFVNTNIGGALVHNKSFILLKE